MERNVKLNKYKKHGGGTLRLKTGRIIKENQVFEADPLDIPQAFKDTLELLKGKEPSAIEAKAIKENIEVKNPTYSLEHLSRGLYNIVDSNGKKITEQPIKGRKKAAEMVQQLTEVGVEELEELLKEETPEPEIEEEEIEEELEEIKPEEIKPEEIEEEKKEETPKVEYSTIHAGGGWYQIVDADGTLVEEKKYREKAAAERIIELNK